MQLRVEVGGRDDLLVEVHQGGTVDEVKRVALRDTGLDGPLGAEEWELVVHGVPLADGAAEVGEDDVDAWGGVVELRRRWECIARERLTDAGIPITHASVLDAIAAANTHRVALLLDTHALPPVTPRTVLYADYRDALLRLVRPRRSSSFFSAAAGEIPKPRTRPSVDDTPLPPAIGDLFLAFAPCNAAARGVFPPSLVADLVTAACRAGDATLVTRLLDGGAEADAPDSSFALPLACAVQGSALAACDVLLARGANPRRGSGLSWDSGAPPLVVAAGQGCLGVCRSLVAAGADVNAADPAGVTPLHAAGRGGHEDVALWLTAQPGVDVNRRTLSGGTPLMFCADSALERVCIELLQCGADVDAASQDGWTAGYFAKVRGLSALVAEIAARRVS